MLNVFITIDTEIWCNGWNDLDNNFPKSYSQYIYAPVSGGNYALTYLLDTFNEFGLHAVFFVEPLFSTRFGVSYLEEIVGLIENAGHEVQLHIHTEWVNESIKPIINNCSFKRQHLCQYSLQEQIQIINEGIYLLEKAGSKKVTAFRAGSFGANNNTLRALEENGIFIDSSYNEVFLGDTCLIELDKPIKQIYKVGNMYEFPVSSFVDKFNGLRHAQLGACSSNELIAIMDMAYQNKWESFVILLHNFELLSPSKQKLDKIMLRRFRKLCSYLASNKDKFNCQGFNNLEFKLSHQPNHPLKSSSLNTAMRMVEQLVRKIY